MCQKKIAKTMVTMGPPNPPPNPSPEEQGIGALAYLRFVETAKTMFSVSETTTASEGNATAFNIPDTNLSGQPIASDPSLTYTTYYSINDLTNNDRLAKN